MAIEFDEEIPKRDEGFWGIRVNGDPACEVIFSDQKPMLCHFTKTHKKIVDAVTNKPMRGIKKLEVVKLDMVELRPPELLASRWYKD